MMLPFFGPFPSSVLSNLKSGLNCAKEIDYSTQKNNTKNDTPFQKQYIFASEVLTMSLSKHIFLQFSLSAFWQALVNFSAG